MIAKIACLRLYYKNVYFNSTKHNTFFRNKPTICRITQSLCHRIERELTLGCFIL